MVAGIIGGIEMDDLRALAIRYVEMGEEYPYDAPDSWLDGDKSSWEQPSNWEYRAACGIISDLCDRRGIKREFSDIDEEVRRDIVDSMVAIIRAAY
jgi:hypothetical protein